MYKSMGTAVLDLCRHSLFLRTKLSFSDSGMRVGVDYQVKIPDYNPGGYAKHVYQWYLNLKGRTCREVVDLHNLEST